MSQLTREQIGEMVAEVENAVCAYTRRAEVPESDLDDVRQELRMNLCRAAVRFDPSRGVKWSSYAIKWIANYLRNRRANMGARYVECQTEDFEDFAAGRSSRFEDDDNHRHRVTEDEDEQDAPFVALSLGVKRSLAEPILSKLSAAQRELIEALVFNGFTAEQYADQSGQPVKVVRCNLKNTLREMAAAGLIDHVMSDAEAGWILNNDRSPVVRKPYSSLSQRVKRSQEIAATEAKRGPIMRRAAKHPHANWVLEELEPEVAAAVRDYLADKCGFNDAAARLGLTPIALSRRLARFRKLAEVGHPDTTPPAVAVEVPQQTDAPNRTPIPPTVAQPIAPPVPPTPTTVAAPAVPHVVTDERPVLKNGYRDPVKLEAADARKRTCGLRSKHDRRNECFQRAAQHPNAPAELAMLTDDVRVALQGYLAGEWDFDQAADLAGYNANSFGLRVQRFKGLGDGKVRAVPLSTVEQGRVNLERQRNAILHTAARHPDADATLAALGEETARAVRAYLAGSMTFNAAADSVGLSPCKLGHRLRAFRKLAAVEPPVSAPAVPERNSGDPIASVGQPLTA